MVEKAIVHSSFNKSVIKELIALILKGSDWMILANWHSIISFNMAYKIYTKTLQFRFQEHFGIPLTSIRIKAPSSNTNSFFTILCLYLKY